MYNAVRSNFVTCLYISSLWFGTYFFRACIPKKVSMVPLLAHLNAYLNGKFRLQ